MIDIDYVKRRAKELLKNKDGIGEVFDFLQIHLDESTNIYDDIRLLNVQFIGIEHEISINVISYENKEVSLNRIRNSLLKLINKVHLKDLKSYILGDEFIESENCENKIKILKNKLKEVRVDQKKIEHNLELANFKNDELNDENIALREEIEQIKKKIESQEKKYLGDRYINCPECDGKGYKKYPPKPPHLYGVRKEKCILCKGLREVRVKTYLIDNI